MTIETPAYVISGTKCDLHPIKLFDIIKLKKINERKIQILKTDGYKIPTNDTNPVFKIASALQEKRPNKFGVNINIQKNIPTFSGLNSQLSNAVGVLIALNKLWEFNLNQKELIEIAKSVDPMIAQILKLQFKPKNRNIILVRPKYIKIDKDWINHFVNMQKIAFKHFPDLKTIVTTLKKHGCDECGMSGKGAVIFGFFQNKIDIQKIKKALSEKLTLFGLAKLVKVKT